MRLLLHGIWFALLTCTCSCGLWAQAAPCDAHVHPLQGSPVQYKDRGQRCEGMYVAEVGSPTLSMVSFHWGSVSYVLKPGEKVIVSVPGVRLPLHVRAVAIPSLTYYRMDALLAPGESLFWPVTDVLLPEHLNAERMGIFAFSGSDSQEVFYPVQTGTTRPAPVPTLTVRPSFDVQKAQWRVAPVRGASCDAFQAWQSVPGSEVSAGQSFRVPLSGVRGPHCIEVNAEGENGWSKSPLRIRVDIPAL